MPTVSVIISTFNRAHLIASAVQSIVDQTFSVHEIIIVDDASTDDTASVVAGLGVDRIKFIRLDENVGQCRARNVGLKAATGELVAVLDSDDRWTPDKIARQVAALEKVANPKRTLIYSQVWQEREGRPSTVEPYRGLAVGERVGDYLFSEKGLIQQSTFLLATSFAREILFDERNRRHSDVGFAIRVQASGGEIAMVEAPLAYWTIAEGAARLSNSTSDGPSLAWLELYRDLLTPRERAGFLGQLVAPSLINGAAGRATGYMLGALKHGAMSPLEVLSVLGRRFLPGSLEVRLRQVAMAVFGRKGSVTP